MDGCCKSYGPFDLNFPKLFSHRLSEGGRGRFAVKHLFGVGVIGVDEDGTIVGSQEAKCFRDVLEREFFDDENQRYRDVPVRAKVLKSGGGHDIRGTHDFVMTSNARIRSLSTKWSIMYPPMLGTVLYREKKRW